MRRACSGAIPTHPSGGLNRDLPRAHVVPVRMTYMQRLIVKAEQDAETLAGCDRLALERFQTLDAMEAEEDEKNAA